MYTLLILFFGLIACVLTGFSWYRNLEYISTRIKKKDFNPSDIYLDYPIRVLWLVYISAFSIGFIVNNLAG